MPRGRPKKINTLETQELQKDSAEKATTGRKSVTRIERYTEPVGDEPEQLEIPVEMPERFDEPKHPFDVVLSDFSNRTEGGYIKVYKLPEYAKNGKASPRNVIREFCANIPVTPDYENVIKESWGGGHYQLELREDDGGFAGARQISIAFPAVMGGRPSLPGQMAHNPATANSGPMGAISYEAPDPMAPVNAALDLILRMRKSFGIDTGFQPANPEPSQQPLNLQTAISYLASQDDTLVEQTMRSFRSMMRGPGGVQETTWLDLVDSAIKSDLIPKTLNSAKALVLEAIGAMNGHAAVGTPAVAPMGEGANHGGGVSNLNVLGNQTQKMASPLPQTEGGLSPEIVQQQEIMARTMQTLLDGCAAYPLHLKGCTDDECKEVGHIGGPANWVMNEEVAYPFLGELINMFIAAPVDQITTWINSQGNGQTYTSLPHWNDWISSLQKALKEASEETSDSPTS